MKILWQKLRSSLKFTLRSRVASVQNFLTLITCFSPTYFMWLQGNAEHKKIYLLMLTFELEKSIVA